MKGLALAFAALLTATAAYGQQLFTFEEVAQGGPGVARSAVTADGIAPSVPIRLDTSLLAARPEKLMLPDMGHGQTWLQKAHFKERDRGLTWAGGAEGGFAETSVLTTHNGYTVGTVLDSGGHRWQVRADPAGVGSMTLESSGPSSDWCLSDTAGEADEDAAHSTGSPDPAARWTESTSSATPSTIIDIVFVSSPRARKYWRDNGLDGNTEVQSFVDFANMVFRNSRIRAEVRAVPTDLEGNKIENSPVPKLDFQLNTLAKAMSQFERLQALRTEYRADLVHIIAYGHFAEMMRVCGIAMIPGKTDGPRKISKIAYGYTDLNCDIRYAGYGKWTFIHELGHNLGVQHNREIPHMKYRRWKRGGSRSQDSYGFLRNPGTPFDDPLKVDSIGDLPGSAGLAGSYPNSAIATIMAYTPKGPGWLRVPYFSMPSKYLAVGELVSSGPNGPVPNGPAGTVWKLGKYDYANNATVIRRTTKLVAEASKHLWRFSHAPENPVIESATDDGSGNVTLVVAWDDVSTDETGFRLVGEEFQNYGGQLGIKALGTFVAPLVVSEEGWSSGLGRRRATWTFPHTDKVIGVDVVAMNVDGDTDSGTKCIGPVSRPAPPVLTLDRSEEVNGENAVAIAWNPSNKFRMCSDPYYEAGTVDVVEESRATGTSDWEQTPSGWLSPLSTPNWHHVFTGPGFDFRVTATVRGTYGDSDSASVEWSVP